MVARLSPEAKMKVRLREGVRIRDDVFGGICYVPHRDDFFAADKKVFSFLQSVTATWRDVPTSDKKAAAALAAIGICETVEPRTAERPYSGPSFLGDFPELPTVSMPLVVNC